MKRQTNSLHGNTERGGSFRPKADSEINNHGSLVGMRSEPARIGSDLYFFSYTSSSDPEILFPDETTAEEFFPIKIAIV